MANFPSDEWLATLVKKLNSDEQYSRIARNWEGDLAIELEADDRLDESIVYYLDLWHGKCRDAYPLENLSDVDAAVSLSAPYKNLAKVMSGDLDVMQALLTRKIHVKGNMALLMRNIPTVLDFVRCCQEVTDDIL